MIRDRAVWDAALGDPGWRSPVPISSWAAPIRWHSPLRMNSRLDQLG